MAENLIMHSDSSDRRVCPSYSRTTEHKKKINCNLCNCIDPRNNNCIRKSEKITYFESAKRTHNETLHNYSGDEAKSDCVSLKSTITNTNTNTTSNCDVNGSSLIRVLYKIESQLTQSQTRTQIKPQIQTQTQTQRQRQTQPQTPTLTLTQTQAQEQTITQRRTDDVLYKQQQQQEQEQEHHNHHQINPAKQITKEIKRNLTIETSCGVPSCLLCKKLQWPIQRDATKRRSSIFFTIIQLLPLLVPCCLSPIKTFKRRQITKARRQNVNVIRRSKDIVRLFIILSRLFVCWWHVTAIPMSIALENTVVREEQPQYGNYGNPQSIAFIYNDNTTATVTQTSQQIPSSASSSSSSPAPVLSAFMDTSGQTLPLTPIDPRILSFVNREHIFKQFQHKINPSVSVHSKSQSQSKSESESEASKTLNTSSNMAHSSCSSCQLRKAKNDSLESIKMHILSKLRLKEAPKIEVPIQVPQNIMKDFKRRYDQNGRRRTFKSIAPLGDEDDIYNDSASGQTRYGKSYDSREDDMQSDDPNAFYDDFEDADIDNDDNDDEEYSLVKSIYIFPTTPRVRHNKKSDFLSFRYENMDETTVIRTILHLYIRGWDWIDVHEPDLSKRFKSNSTREKPTEFLFSVHRALKRANASNYTHTVQMTELRQYIPSGIGHWIQIDLKDLADIWIEGGESHQVVVIKTPESWMRHLIVTGTGTTTATGTGTGKNLENKNLKRENGLTAHIEVRTQRKAGRHRRSTSLDCQESDNEVRCCRYPLKVNFTSFGWSFVVAPTDFDAYFCNGECKLGYLEQYTHTHIASLSRSASPCCSPTKMSSLTLLYFNLDQNLVLSTIPNMTVDKCSCS